MNLFGRWLGVWRARRVLRQVPVGLYGEAREIALACALEAAGPSIVPALVAALESDDVELRTASAVALGSIGDRSAEPSLLRTLHHRDAELRRASARALSALGWQPRSASESAAIAAAGGDFEGAARAGSAAVASLLLAASGPEHAEQALEALERIGEAAVEPLCGALGQKETGAAAARALAMLGEVAADAVCEIARHAGASHRERRRRARAYDALGAMRGVRRALDFLVESVDGPDRMAAVGALAGHGPAAAGALWPLRDAGDKDLRTVVAAALGDVGDVRAVPLLVEHLGSPDDDVRHRAIRLLARLGDGRAVAPLEALGQRFGADDQLLALHAMGEIGGPEAVRALLDALSRERRAGCRVEAAEALGRIGDQAAFEGLSEAAREPDPELRRASILALGHVGGAGALAWLSSLALGGGDDGYWAQLALVEAGASGVATVAALLRAPDPEHRLVAVDILSRCSCPEATFALLEALSDDKGRIRGRAGAGILAVARRYASAHGGREQKPVDLCPLLAAVRTAPVCEALAVLLEVQPSPSLGEKLVSLLSTEESAAVRVGLVRCLGAVADGSLFPSVVAALDDADALVVEQASRSALRFGERGVVEVLRRAAGYSAEAAAKVAVVLSAAPASQQGVSEGLGSPEPALRALAAEVERLRADPGSGDAMRGLLSDPEPGVRLSAAGYFAAAPEPLDEESLRLALGGADLALRRALLDVAYGSPARFGELLLGCASSVEPSERSQAARALCRLGGPRATEALLRLVRDAEAMVRREAASALGALREPRAVQALVPLLGDPDEDVARAAALAIGEAGTEEAVSILLAAAAAPRHHEDVLFEALGRTRHAAAVAPLIQLLRERGNSPVAGHIELALGALGPVAVAPLMVVVECEPDVRERAQRALNALSRSALRRLLCFRRRATRTQRQAVDTAVQWILAMDRFRVDQ